MNVIETWEDLFIHGMNDAKKKEIANEGVAMCQGCGA